LFGAGLRPGTFVFLFTPLPSPFTASVFRFEPGFPIIEPTFTLQPIVNMNRLIITSFLFCLLGVSIYPKMLAQEATSAPEPGLSLICRYVEGNILLRWAPANPAVWTDGQRHGYQIERLEFDSQDGPDLTKFQPLHTAPIRPLSLTEFQNLRGQQPQNDYLAAMAECLYGEGPLAQGMSGDWLSAADDHLNRYSFALFTAEMDFEAAQAAGWALVDEDIIPGKTYLYQVRLAKRPLFGQPLPRSLPGRKTHDPPVERSERRRKPRPPPLEPTQP
jgi:hypothetical protein